MSATKTKYVDGYVLVVPKSKVAAYRKMARAAGKMWMRCGAVEYKECVGEDLFPKVGGMKMRTFPEMAGARKSETVWFSWIGYRSKAHRDRVNKKVNAEIARMAGKYRNVPMPFDLQRMAYGGFGVLVEG